MLAADVDWIALSFVQRPEDIIEVRKIVQGRAGVMAKIEKPQAVERLDEIIKLSDAFMIARGDLGVEMPLEAGAGPPEADDPRRPPLRQAGGRRHADAGIDDHLAGADPRRSLRRLDRRVRRRRRHHAVGRIGRGRISGRSRGDDEPDRHRGRNRRQLSRHHPRPARRARSDRRRRHLAAARQVAETLDLAAIVTYTASGSTGLRAARERPQKPIIALSPILRTARRLSLVWGIHCVVSPDAVDLDDMVDRACLIACEEGFGRPGDRIVITAGIPLGTPGATNMLRIAYVGSEAQGSR